MNDLDKKLIQSMEEKGWTIEIGSAKSLYDESQQVYLSCYQR